MANATPVVSPADVIKIVIVNQTNADGTLTPANLSQASATPVVSPVDAQTYWIFVVNSDGTLTSTKIGT